MIRRPILRQRFCYFVVLNKKFITQLMSDLLLQIEQVFRPIGITLHAPLCDNTREYDSFMVVTYLPPYTHDLIQL
ncbi:hypothetical protein D9603_03850 [Pseudoalteromonas sp. PS5]|nr:hypothetical protein D9603_03850 [Pseudoalteromonas sp. PS5]